EPLPATFKPVPREAGKERRVTVPSAIAERELLDAEHFRRTLRRIAHEIVEKHADPSALALVGIYTRGVTLADRLHGLIADLAGVSVPTGALDITFYRDDVTVRSGEQRAHPQ